MSKYDETGWPEDRTDEEFIRHCIKRCESNDEFGSGDMRRMIYVLQLMGGRILNAVDALNGAP